MVVARPTLCASVTTEGLSCTTNCSWGYFLAILILVDPIPPPTSTTTDWGGSFDQSKPQGQVRSVGVLLPGFAERSQILTLKNRVGGISLRRAIHGRIVPRQTVLVARLFIPIPSGLGTLKCNLRGNTRRRRVNVII